MKINKQKLLNAFINRTPITINGQRWIVNGIEHEDGSTYNFNITGYVIIRNSTYKKTMFVRTTD